MPIFGAKDAMNRRSFCSALAVPLILATAVFAQTPAAQPKLDLRPEPKELRLNGEGFRLRPSTKILVAFGHQAEDRIAAETLAEEISDQSGLNVSIVGAKTKLGKGKTIILARLDDRRVRKFLAAKGLNVNDSIGDEGYLLFSDKSHLIVAANTGEGLFYGVQTLRQLLRPDGKNLMCPAVQIRDWPGLHWPAPGDIS
jgi:hexosaminidase